jgi:hypothetical protein
MGNTCSTSTPESTDWVAGTRFDSLPAHATSHAAKKPLHTSAMFERRCNIRTPPCFGAALSEARANKAACAFAVVPILDDRP